MPFKSKVFTHLTLDSVRHEKFKKITDGKKKGSFAREHLIPKYFNSEKSIVPFDGKERVSVSIGMEPSQRDMIVAFAKENSVPIGVITNSMVASYES